MREEYIRENKILDKTDKEKNIELIISILKAKKDLEEANKNFEYAEEELIDYYIYQIKASRSKFNYLVKQAKEKGLTVDVAEQLEIKLNKAI